METSCYLGTAWQCVRPLFCATEHIHSTITDSAYITTAKTAQLITKINPHCLLKQCYLQTAQNSKQLETCYNNSLYSLCQVLMSCCHATLNVYVARYATDKLTGSICAHTVH